jgi:hypothetical protein
MDVSENGLRMKLMLTDWILNCFYFISDIAPLGSLLHLVNLNLKGNPVSEKEDYKEKVIYQINGMGK